MYSKNKQKDQRQLLRKVKCQTPFLDDDLLSIGESVGTQQPRLSGINPQKSIIVMIARTESWYYFVA
jgi:hypothetical protein